MKKLHFNKNSYFTGPTANLVPVVAAGVVRAGVAGVVAVQVVHVARSAVQNPVRIRARMIIFLYRLRRSATRKTISRIILKIQN